VRIFLVGAVVLIVLGIIASASDSMQSLGVWWYTWLMASLLSFFVDLLTGLAIGAGGVTYTYGRNASNPSG
jgi:hypothetical protein